MGVAETYADYMPSKCELVWFLKILKRSWFLYSSVLVKLGKKHPDPVVETASLSSVESCDVWYKLSLPEDCISSGALSALQLEAVTYASQQHDHILPDGETKSGLTFFVDAFIITFVVYFEFFYFFKGNGLVS